MKGRLFLNVVVLQSSAVFKLSAAEDQLLLIGRNTFFVLNLLFYFGIESDGSTSSNGLVSESSVEDFQALLVRRNTFLILKYLFEVLI